MNRHSKAWLSWRYCKQKNYEIKKQQPVWTGHWLSLLSPPCRTLNNNNLTALPRDLFAGLRLRALRLSDNPFACDCHLSWLSRYLRTASRLAPNTKCHSPSQLKGQNVADLHDQDFKCSGKWCWSLARPLLHSWSSKTDEEHRCSIIAIQCSPFWCLRKFRRLSSLQCNFCCLRCLAEE